MSFIRPHGVIYDGANDFFSVTDTARGRISKYASDASSFVEQFGTPGTTGTDLFFPGSGHGSTESNTVTLFADTRNSLVKRINDNVITNTPGVASTTAIPGTATGQFYNPESTLVFTDAITDYLLAANTLNNRVEVFDAANADTEIEIPQDPLDGNFGSPFD